MSLPANAQLPGWQASLIEALDQRQFESAEKTLNEVLATESENVDALRLRADLAARRGRVAEALTQIGRLLSQHPEDRRSHVLQAQWLIQVNRFAAAMDVYDRWLQQEPDDVDMRIRRALVLRQRGELSAAIGQLEYAVAAEPGNRFAQHSLVRTLLAARRTGDAWRTADTFDSASDGKDAELGLIKAGIVARLGAADLAAELLSRAPSDPDQTRRQLAFRAMEFIRTGRQQQGLALLITTYPRTESVSYDVLVDLGNAYAAADQLRVARDHYLRAAEMTPQRPEARLGLARLASREGRLSDSLARYRSIIDETPEALEASLGVIRIARLLDDGEAARAAVDHARRFAPQSLELIHEEILLALEAGDIPGFVAVLEQFEKAHPGDPVARLWRLRWRAMETKSLDFQATKALLDPFDPDVTAGALYLLTTVPNFDLAKELGEWIADESLPARAELFRSLAHHMALRLRRDTALQLIQLAHQAMPNGADSGAADELPRMLAAGWWAHVAAPFAWARELSPEFDPQAVQVWLAAEVQRRLRTFAIEAESPLEEEWLLHRAVWFTAWRGNWQSPDAANSLYDYLAFMIPNAFDGITRAHIENAWRDSEHWLPAADFNLRVTQARWRQERFDFAGALDLYRRLAREFPGAGEPVQRQSVLLRGLGRTREALAVLRELTSRPDANPVTRLEAAQLLTRLGEHEAAHRQLALAEEADFDEPLLYVRRAELEDARNLRSKADQWIEKGLERHAAAPALLALRAGRLLESRETRALAAMVRAHSSAPWLTPDLVAAAKPHLNSDELERITTSPSWWFQFRWLPWQRLEAQSLAALRTTSREASGLGQRERALDVLRPAAAARIPDTDLWLAVGRMFDVNGEWDEAERAYRFAHALGLGRPDAEVNMLSRRARRTNPEVVARDFAARLAANPDDFGLRAGFVVAAIRAGEVTAAERALEPLIEADPESPVVRDLAAEVKGAKGNIRQARSLYASMLRGDPTDTDRRDAMRALRGANQWGFATGYEFSDLRSTTDLADPADWHEAYAGVFWQQPVRQSWALEYRWFDRANQDASHLRADYSIGLNDDWIARGHAAPAVEGNIIPEFRAGGGVSHRLREPLFATFDFEWLTFSDLNVYQFTPGLSWRWHPRSTIDTRVYLNHNVLDTGTGEWTATWLLNANWEFAPKSSARITFAHGDESVANPIRDLIGNDHVTSIGLSLHLGLGYKWTVIPAWRYERHDRFDLNAFGLNAVFSY